MEFYTKEWKNYIYRSWKDALPTNNNITDMTTVYDGYYYETMKYYAFERYYKNKKEYVSLAPKLEKIFGKYEKITLLPEEEEKQLYFKKIEEFIKKYKTKLLQTIEILKSYNLDIELELNDMDFELLALNKINLKIKRYYQKLRHVYKKYIEDNDLLTDENLDFLKDIDSIYNNINSFLTSYTEYIEYRNDKYFKLIDSKSFHDCPVIKYEDNDNQIIIEIQEYDNNGFRFILNNPKVIISKEEDGKLTEINIKLNTDKIVDIYYNNYELYEDMPNHLEIQYCVSSEIDKFSGIVNVDYYAESIIGEEFIINEKLEEYLTSSETYQNNLKEISDMIDEETYILLSQPYFNKLIRAIIDSYTFEHDLLLNFKSFFPEEYFSLNFEKANIEIKKDDTSIFKEQLENILKERIEETKKQYSNDKNLEGYEELCNSITGVKFIKKNNLIEASIIIANDIEIIILCNKITLLSSDFEIKKGALKILANSDDYENLIQNM